MDGLTTGGSLVEGEQNRAPLLVYCSHFLSAWGIRAFEFLVPLVLVHLYDGSLFMVAVFGLLDSLVIVLSSPFLGRYVDSSERYTAATTMYFVQNIATAVSSVGLWMLLYRKEMKHGMLGVVFVGLCILSACAASLGAVGSSISVEREWTKTLCGSNDENMLASMNAVMKRIDLVSLIGSPIAVGLILETYGYLPCLVVLCLYNITAWILECYALKLAVRCSDRLKETRKYPTNGSEPEMMEEVGLREQLQMYMKQSCFFFAISLAIIYMTVMSFGSTMTAFLALSGIGESTLSLFRGFGALSGVSATLVSPRLSVWYGLEKTAMLAIIGQATVLIAAVAPMIVWKESYFAELVLLSFLSVSRFFLWLFDISVNQIIQENATRGSVGTIFGVQSGLQYTFQSLAYIWTLFWPEPGQFLALMVLSDMIILIAMSLTVFGYWKSQGSLSIS